jgi:hypothetical protein
MTGMMSIVTRSASQGHASGLERAEARREAATLVLYASVVEIAELASLPERHFSHGVVTGPVGIQLLAIIWGTAIGLAIAHWFAFGVVAPAFSGQPTRIDTRIGIAQLGGAVLVPLPNRSAGMDGANEESIERDAPIGRETARA